MAENQENKKFYGWILVAVLWLIYFLNVSFPMYGGSVVNSFLVKDLGISRTSLGLAVSLFTLLQGLPAPLFAWMINKKGIRYTLFFGSAILVVGALAMATVVHTATTFLLVYGVVMGLGIGFGAVIAVQTGITLWFRRKRALALSIALTAAGIGGFIAAPLMNAIIASSGGHWQPAYLFMVGASGVAALLALFFVKNKPEDLGQVPDGIVEEVETESVSTQTKVSRVFQTKEDWTLKEAVKTSSLWLILIGGAGFFVPYFICLAHGVLHLLDKGIPTTIAATSIGLITLFSIVGRLLIGVLGDRIEPRYIFSCSLLLMVIGCFAILNANTVSYVYLYAVCIGIGFGGAYVCMSAIYGNYFGAKAFASILGSIYPVISILGSLAPALAGMIFDATGSYNIALYIGAACALLGAVCLLLAKPPKRSLSI